MGLMSDDIVKNKQLWVPPRSYGVCIWILPNGTPLSDGDGVLSAQGFVGDKDIEKRVAQAAKYWTGSDEGEVAWVQGARKVSASERDDQVERLENGMVADPFEDLFDSLRKQ